MLRLLPPEPVIRRESIVGLLTTPRPSSVLSPSFRPSHRLAFEKVWLIHSMLMLNEPTFDFKQFDQGAKWSCRVLELYYACARPNGLCNEMLQRTWRQLNDASLWAHLPQTESMSTDLLRIALRPGAVIVQNVFAEFAGFPLKTFALVSDPSVAPEIIQVAKNSPCLIDEFTAGLLQRFPDAHALQSKQCRLELLTVAELTVGNAFDLERLHSKTSRKAKTRIHTHVAALADLAVFLQGWAAPTFLPNKIQDCDCSVRGWV